jgi:hypothetical protein
MKYLDSELAKCDSWEEFRSNNSIKPIFNSEPEYRSAKGKGVGQTTLLKFLGKNWSQSRISQALEDIREEVIIQAL